MGRHKKNVDTTDFQVGQDKPRNMPSTGPARIETPEIEVVDGVEWKNKAETLAFMEEEVDVTVHQSTDKNAEAVVQVWNDGRAQFFVRGRQQKVKRKFVEVLARCKQTGFVQEYYVDGQGNNAIRNIPQTALRYPFTINHDLNRKGPDWIRKVLAEAN